LASAAPTDVTQLLFALSRGDKDALSRLLPLVYDELHAIAGRAMRRERSDHTLQTTALVNEAFLKLVDQSRAQWQHRSQFFAVAAQVMRRILVDHARARQAAKRGGAGGEGDAPVQRARVSIEAAEPAAPSSAVDVVALDEALTRLAAMDEQQGRIVELRFFGGLTVEQTADLLGISPATVKRDWTVAKAWLHREIAGE
jgi:RNA polymerase sigma factor (TIGR02999 family)